MSPDQRIPRALLLTRSPNHRDQIRAVLEARGWAVDSPRVEDALMVVERQHFTLCIVELSDDPDNALDEELCAAVGGGCGTLLVVAGLAQLNRAAELAGSNGGDLLMTPFSQDQVNVRIALAEHRLSAGRELPADLPVSTRMSQLEKSLRYHQASMDELFQNAPEGIAIVDPEDRVIRINDAFTRMFGYTQEEALGQPINDLIAPEHLLDEALSISRGVRTHRHLVEETLRRRRDGSLLDVSVVATPITIGEGQEGAFGIYRDISKHRAQERALQASESRYHTLFDEAKRVNAELLEQTRQMKDAMAAKNWLYTALNHELRTPISAVMLFQELLLAGSMGELLPDQRNALERSHTATKHLLGVVRDVLDMSRLEAGGLGVHLEAVDLGELMSELTQTAQPVTESQGSPIDFHAPADLPTIVTDPQRLRQIVLNLISNAAKFGEGKPIELTCTCECAIGGGAVIAVRDSGRGIAPEDHSRIFEDFVQVGGHSEAGTGLGLPIARRLAELLGGTLDLESDLGGGSEFRLVLPVRISPRTDDQIMTLPAASVASSPGAHP
jgi:PAS domain S-box-containing protein